MLVFNVTFKCAPGMRDAFLDGILREQIIPRARAEAGNLQYDYFIPVGNDDELFLVEKYRDDEAVGAHVRQAHTAKLVELKEAYVSDMILERYEKPDDCTPTDC